MKLLFVTGNSGKFSAVQEILRDTLIELDQIDLDTPEMQSLDLKEIAEYSARWAVSKVGKPLLVNDSGYFIPALNNFPGPFVKYACQQLEIEDWLNLMRDKKDRTMIVKTATTIIKPGFDPLTFEHCSMTTLVQSPSDIKVGPNLNRMMIPEGYKKIFTDMSPVEQMSIWKRDIPLDKNIGEIREYLEL